MKTFYGIQTETHIICGTVKVISIYKSGYLHSYFGDGYELKEKQTKGLDTFLFPILYIQVPLASIYIPRPKLLGQITTYTLVPQNTIPILCT